MSALRFLCFSLALLGCFLPASTFAQAPQPTPSPSDAAAIEAFKLLQTGKYPEALAQLDVAEKYATKNPSQIWNLRGAIYTKMQDYPKAAAAFESARKADPTQFEPRFNLAEIYFVQKKYSEAREMFLKLQESYPKHELVKFKIYLTYLMEKNDEEAQKTMKSLRFPSDEPAYYFAKAAWEFAHQTEGDQKPLKEAQSYLQSAINIFPAQKNAVYIESFMDLGWLKRNEPIPSPAAAPAPGPAKRD